MIDWHCHILPGIDDGPSTTDQAEEMAAILQKAGFTEVYCTPHQIKGSYDAGNDTVRKAVSALQKRLDARGVDLRLHAGREYYLDEFILDYMKEPLPLGETNYLLIEAPSHVAPEYVKEVCYCIKCSGLTPMIAHPERCDLFAIRNKENKKGLMILHSLLDGFYSKLKPQNTKFEDASLLGYLKEIGCAFQGNLGSFDGKYGDKVQLTAMHLQRLKVFSHFGTDMHSPLQSYSKGF